MSFVGINVGALTVKVVTVQRDVNKAKVVAHRGRPLDVLDQLLAAPEFEGAEYFSVSGHLGHISEFAAIQRALDEVRKRAEGEFDAVASLGGESFLVYTLAGGRVANVLSHNKCAAGSGEFFVQLIGRMGMDIDAAISLSSSGKVVPLASRCTVHCKSDVTHKLNRHEATPADILKTLHESMAGKVVALLEKGQASLRRVLLIGGVTRNAAFLEALREKLPASELVVLPESEWFEAWGSALLTRENPIYKSPHLSHPPVFDTLPPLHQFEDQVHVMAAPPLQVPPPTVLWCWVWMQARRRPRRFCSILRREPSWLRITRARTTILWPQFGSASGHSLSWSAIALWVWSAQRARPGNWLARSWELSECTTRFQPTPPAQRTLPRTWTPSLKSAARTPSTFTCAMACPLAMP